MDNNQNPIKNVNERNLFPEYVNAVNDEEYDLENDLSDIIYIHNPDEENAWDMFVNDQGKFVISKYQYQR